MAGRGQPDRMGSRQRGLAHPALAAEQHEPRGPVVVVMMGMGAQQQTPASGNVSIPIR